MGKYNPNTKEQIMKLKDGRTIYKTHNGFKSWLVDQKGATHSITNEYYSQVKIHAI